MARPITCMRAGTRTVRTMSASSRTATARPRPKSLSTPLAAEGEGAEDEHQDAGRGGDDPAGGSQAVVTARPLSAPFTQASRMRLTRKTW